MACAPAAPVGFVEQQGTVVWQGRFAGLGGRLESVLLHMIILLQALQCQCSGKLQASTGDARV